MLDVARTLARFDCLLDEEDWEDYGQPYFSRDLALSVATSLRVKQPLAEFRIAPHGGLRWIVQKRLR